MENTTPTPIPENKQITIPDGRTQTLLIIFAAIALFCAGAALGFTGKDVATHLQKNSSKHPPQVSAVELNSIPTPIPGKDKKYTSKELNMSFQYPNELGEIEENIPTDKKTDVYWTAFFKGLNVNEAQAGFIELIANSLNFQPISWEGTPRWINDQITSDDSEESLKQKLIKSNYDVISVTKVVSANKQISFKVWLLDGQDAAGYNLVRDYIFPLKESQFTNLQIYSVIQDVNFAGVGPDIKVDRSLTKARSLADNQISVIELKKADKQTQK